MKYKANIIKILVALMFICSMSASAFQMNSTNYAISSISNSAGGNLNSSNYLAVTAIGESVLGYSNSTNFSLYLGIFYSFFIPPEEENVTYDPCDLNHDGIVYNDWNDLIAGYKCFLGTENCNKISYQNWTAVRDEYGCFVGAVNR